MSQVGSHVMPEDGNQKQDNRASTSHNQEDLPASTDIPSNAMHEEANEPISKETFYAMEFVSDFEKESEQLRSLRDEDIMTMTWPTYEAALNWYNRYAKAWLFTARMDEKTVIGGIITNQHLVCGCEGRRRKRTKENVRESRPETRCDCKAMFRFAFDKSTTIYRVTKFRNDHSHKLVYPQLAHHMPSMRKMSDVDINIQRQYRAGGIGPSKAFDTEMNKVGGHAYMGHTKRDAQNQAHRDHLKQFTEGDAATALAFLESKLEKDKKFFLKYTFDSENRLEKVLWADSMSIADYSCFGDLLLFDATYKKNIYNMPLIIFSGINHHYQTCIFVCALVQHEREENYVWALETLTEAMGGKLQKL
ncbi:Protein FAR1-RELATED SEQUENCE 5 [Linum grandiflorum]